MAFEGPFVRSAYNYDMMAASDESGLECKDPSRTSQAFAEESDINVIVNRFLKTGTLPPTFRAPTYGDFSGVSDYQGALNAVIKANEAFDQLPAGMRARFHNNPQVLLEFLSNPDNREEATKLGLLRAPEAPPLPLKVEVVSPPSDASGDAPKPV